MKKYLKFVFIFLTFFLIGLSYYNIQRYIKDDSFAKPINSEEYYRKLAYKFENLKFPVIEIKDIIDKKETSTEIDKGFVILLSNTSCNPCQLRELKNLEALLKKTEKKLKIYAIFVSNYSQMEALRLRKISQISFPICYVTNNGLEKFNSIGIYPLIFFINNQQIVSTLIPIPDNEGFSKSFYNAVESISMN